MSEHLEKLKDPFPPDAIEWRIGQAGVKGNGQVWATCLAYVQARAIMDRLDEVVGPANWRVEYSFVDPHTLKPGVIAKLSIKIDGEWITKEDGADQTDIDEFKGGISGALKRAGVVWGIGRYLYNLEQGFADTSSEKLNGWYRGYLKNEKKEFWWIPKPLPEWALPKGYKKPEDKKIVPEQPPEGDGVRGHADGEYRITFGKFKKKKVHELSDEELTSYTAFLVRGATEKGVQISGQAEEFINHAWDELSARCERVLTTVPMGTLAKWHEATVDYYGDDCPDSIHEFSEQLTSLIMETQDGGGNVAK